MVMEIVILCSVVGYLYHWKFVMVVGITVVIYFILSICVTEWRSKYFKEQSKKNAEYTQKATDSLLNFESVKYFEASQHE